MRAYEDRKSGVRPLRTPAQKRCTKCKIIKVASEFRRSFHNDSGLEARCNSCISAENREKLYGTTEADYALKMVEQGCVCAICGRPEMSRANHGGKLKDLAQDHDHTTGANRGLLCSNCNKGLGNLGDDPERLMKAAAYLLSYQNILTAEVI